MPELQSYASARIQPKLESREETLFRIIEGVGTMIKEQGEDAVNTLLEIMDIESIVLPLFHNRI